MTVAALQYEQVCTDCFCQSFHNSFVRDLEYLSFQQPLANRQSSRPFLSPAFAPVPLKDSVDTLGKPAVPSIMQVRFMNYLCCLY